MLKLDSKITPTKTTNGVLNPLDIPVGSRKKKPKTGILAISGFITASILSTIFIKNNPLEPQINEPTAETRESNEVKFNQDILINEELNFDLSNKDNATQSLTDFYKKITGEEIYSPFLESTDSSILIKDNLTSGQILFDGNLENGSIVIWDRTGTSYATCFIVNGQIENNICFRHN